MQKLNVTAFMLHNIWYMIKDFPNSKQKDDFLYNLGLSRIIKQKKFFLATYEPENFYKTNIKIVDEHKFFLAKIKYGF